MPKCNYRLLPQRMYVSCAVTGGAEDMEVADLTTAMLQALPASVPVPHGNPRTFGTVPRLLRAFAAAGFRDITAKCASPQCAVLVNLSRM